MADLSGAFGALPGGFGMAEELCENVMLVQLGSHRKPIGLLDVASSLRPDRGRSVRPFSGWRAPD